MSKNFTKTQSTYIDAINKFVEETGRKPSMRELCKIMNINSPASAHYMIKRLEEKGYDIGIKAYINRQREEIARLIIEKEELKLLIKKAYQIINFGN